MKKIFSFICAISLVLCFGISLTGCKVDNSVQGTYVVDYVEVFGLKASKANFEAYEKTRNESDLKNNAAYVPFRVIFNMKIVLKTDADGKNVGSLSINDYNKYISQYDAFEQAQKQFRDYQEVNDALDRDSFEYNGLTWETDDSQKDAYFIYPVSPDGEKIDIDSVVGVGVFQVITIHATIKDGRMAFRVGLALYQTADRVEDQTLVRTDAIIQMKKVK